MRPEPVTVVIPAYNEETGIAGVISQICEVLGPRGFSYEIIVVDDGSSDETALVAHRSGARVVRHARNRGYGASLKTGILAARNDVIVITDADGTYPVSRITEMLQELNEADLVV